MKYFSKTPLRLGLSGGGTDLPEFIKIENGRVLNATISLYTYCEIEENKNGEIYFNASDLSISKSFKFEKKLQKDLEFQIYITIHNYFFENFKFYGKCSGYSLTTFSDVPKGSGLGGSSTLIVSIINCFSSFFNVYFDKYQLAELSFHIERKILKIVGGAQDQYAASFGGFNYIEFHKNKTVVNPLNISKKSKNHLQSMSVLYYSNIERQASQIETEKSNIIKHKNKSIDSLKKIKKLSYEMKNSLLMGNINQIIDNINHGWKSKKNLSRLVSNNNLDKIISNSFDLGAKAAKVSGAGGGGFIYFLVDLKNKNKLIEYLNSTNGKVYNFEFTESGSRKWKTNL